MASPGSDRSERLSGTGTNQTRSETESAQEKAEGLTDRAREKAGELKHKAEEAAHGMRDRARSMADQQKHAAVGRVEGVAHALRKASDDLRDQGQPMIAEYSRYAAEGLESMAQSLDRRNIDDFVEGVENFARQRPVAFLGGAMVAGFALARFMKSSSARRGRDTGAYGGYGRTRAYGGMEGPGMRSGARARSTSQGTGRTATSGSWPAGGTERDAGTIGMPGAERDAGTIATPGAGTTGMPGQGGGGMPGTSGAGRPGTGTAGTPGAGGHGRSGHGDL